MFAGQFHSTVIFYIVTFFNLRRYDRRRHTSLYMVNLEIRQSYEALYKEYFTPLFRYVFFRTKDTNTAKDLTQNVFLKFLNQGYVEREKDHNIKLLFIIARTTLIDHYRKKSTNLEEHLGLRGNDLESSEPGPDVIYESKEKVLAVRESFKELSDIEEDIVLLRITTNTSYKEIGEIHSITEENARKIYSRALQKIEEYLKRKNISYE